MTDHAPSPAQLEAYARRATSRPVVLYYQLGHRSEAQAAQAITQLRELARGHGGRIAWRGTEQQVLIGQLAHYQHAARMHFRSRSDALALVQSAQHGALFGEAAALQVAVLSQQPTASRALIRLMALVLPRWPLFDNHEEDTPEPGIGQLSVMPTQADYETFLANPQPTQPIVMVNWLRFRERARYTPGDPDAADISGQAAYYRYGKIAFLTLHSLGARALFVSRYQQILIGHNGDPGLGLWHEFAMVEYPGRRVFKRMTALRRYRAALHHRTAGLDEGGQGLVVTSGVG